MINVMVSIAGVQAANKLTNYSPKGLVNFLVKKGTGIGLGDVAKAAMGAYLAYEFGQAAKPLFDQLVDISDRIANLDTLSMCDQALEQQAITDQIAQATLEFVKEVGIGKLDGVMGKLSFNKKKDKKENQKYGSKEFFKDLNASGKKSSMYGLLGEKEATRGLEDRGWTTLKGEKITQPNWNQFKLEHAAYTGQTGIDGIFKRIGEDGNIEYMILEVKTKVNGIQPAKCRAGSRGGSLCGTQDGYQLSDNWILGRVGTSGLSRENRENIEDAIEKPTDNPNIKITRYLARVSNNKVEYHEITPKGGDDVGAVGGTADFTYNHILKKW